ncbi:MAG: class I SAM-dependent methyltransferase [Clostridia bacterium]|nr:class I SAM-dependent methyltransferase [Clostridia bacterium]
MDDFFAARIDGYDAHMRRDIEGASGFYAYTASLLPSAEGSRVMDLGCGTGLELEEYFALNPAASVTGIDLSEVMLNVLKAKFPDKDLTLIRASYFDVPLGNGQYDAAVSVESLHHFPAAMKAQLYKKLCSALTENGVFILTDYFAESKEMEQEYFRDLAALKKEQGLSDDVFYHYDTPLTVDHEMDVLSRAGFRDVRIMKQWGESTYTVLACKTYQENSNE